MTRGPMGMRAGVRSGLAGILVFAGLTLLQVGGADPEAGGWSALLLRATAALLVAHAAFWWGAVEHARVSTVGFGALAGALWFLIVFDARSADPRVVWPDAPAAEGTGMEQAHQAWNEFREAPWRWFRSEAADGMRFDTGALLAGGGVPLVGIPAKWLSSWLTAEFHYFGMWLLGCYVLQGVTAALLMRCLTHHPRLQMLGVGLFVLSPILLNSAAYPATAAHGLLLAGLWLYFRTVVAGRQAWVWGGWLVLSVVSMAVHGQVAVMVVLLGLAFLARCVWIDRSIGLGRGLVEAVVLISAVVGVGYGLGCSDWRGVNGLLCGADAGLPGAMNLAGPVDPAGWSTLLQSWSPPAAQASVAFAYLGAGVLVLAFWCWLMVVMRPLDPSGFRPWIPLLGLGVILTMVSVLPQVAAGRYVLLDLSGVAGGSGHAAALAASGRYFWLVSYALLFLLIALVVHAHPPGRAMLLLAFALTLQVADLRERIGFVRDQVRKSVAVALQREQP